MSRLNMIPKLSMYEFEKCTYCSQAKITKTSHKSVTRVIESLELIHFDLCEFDDMLTRNSKRYLIMFIDDCSDFALFTCLEIKIMHLTCLVYL